MDNVICYVHHGASLMTYMEYCLCLSLLHHAFFHGSLQKRSLVYLICLPKDDMTSFPRATLLQGNLVGNAPEPQALQWAARNPWFGTDSEMTYYAYEVHDHLIEAEGYDPNSKEYYEQIGLRVAAQFPERSVQVPFRFACAEYGT